jgi:GT2 family glycosyltransferase/Flp pilus assembly protein TadD
MTRRYLFGPIAADFAAQNLRQPRSQGDCLAFDLAGGLDLTIAPSASWEEVCRRWPAGWQPDCIFLWLPYAQIPRCLWSAPVPLIGLAADWQLLWHGYRARLAAVELILTDTLGVRTFHRAGLDHAQAAVLYGCGPEFLQPPATEVARDIDILFVGNFQPAIQRQRLPWLGRLARLAGRWRVQVLTGVFGADYRQLLRRARMVFNYAVRGECNQRVAETLASGALLFQEAGNLEVPHLLTDRREYVAYTEENFEELLEYYLEHEDERQSVAEAGHRRIHDLTFAAQWEQALAVVDREWPRLLERLRRRPTLDPVDELVARSWEALSSSSLDPTLPTDLAARLVAEPRVADWHNALGLALVTAAGGPGRWTAPLVRQAAGYFGRALQSDPHHLVAGLNLVECLASLEQKALAFEHARTLLAFLDRPPSQQQPSWLQASHYPPGFDLFRVEWEKAAWQHAGHLPAETQAKRTLLRWRLHSLLATLTNDLVHYEEAALARPDLPPSRAALGCALGRAQRSGEAAYHLQEAVRANPFDREAARALFQALADTGDGEGQLEHARQRALLARAAPQLVPVEPWFREAPAAADELASIIILCCNELEYTRLCLDSVLAHTRPPYELILVDNGSSDGTAPYLDELRSRSGPLRVEVIHNAANLGFPKGSNQGLAKAKGRYLVLLNNDTLVTEQWLEGLIGWAVQGNPCVGLVGPTSNYCPPPQQVPVGYADRPGLDAFAAQRRRAYAGKALEVERLTGFCLLLRREVLEAIGGFDEGFGAGFFDDDDLCVRAREAGFRLLVAQNVYIHHFGSRTFQGLGIDCRQQLERNFERFQAKWGRERSAGYRLPSPELTLAAPEAPWPPPEAFRAPSTPSESDPPVAPTAIVPAAGKVRVSLCLIVKNEEDNLAACLDSAADLVEEIVLVDTGSTDRTKEIAARYGARIIDFPWCDSFSAARNEGLRHATGDWIFWLDADDRLDDANRSKLRELFAGLDHQNLAYSMKCLCLPDAKNRTATAVDHIRLFRNHPQVRWQYRVHEQILPAIRDQGGDVRFTEIVIHHTGYCDPGVRAKKLQRDLRLLHLEQAEQPDDPFTLFNLGAILQELGQHAEALPCLRRSLERSQPSDSIVRKIYALLVGCHKALGQKDPAFAACQEGRRHYPEDVELLFAEGILRRDQGDLEGAAGCLEQLLTSQAPPHFASVDAGLKSYKGRHNLALVYQQQGRWAEAEAQWRAALAERPDFLPSLLGLGELFLSQRRWPEIDQLRIRLTGDPEGALEGAVLQARSHLARQEFAEAKKLLVEVIGHQPRALYPHVILSHVLLQEGKDLTGAEEALRDVLALDPGHAEARHNLSVLLQKQNRAADDYVAQGTTLADLYQAACSTSSDIHEHLPTLFDLASRCRHVTELGTNTGLATTALLFAQPDTLVCYGPVKWPQLQRLQVLAGRTRFHFRQVAEWPDQMEETDLLLIQDAGDPTRLQEALDHLAGKVGKYLVLHGLHSQGGIGPCTGDLGLILENLLASGRFRLEQAAAKESGGLIILVSTGSLPPSENQARLPA